MTAFFKKIFKGNMIYGIVLVLVGIIFAVWPEASRSTLIRLIGIALVLTGIALVVLFFMSRRQKSGIPVNLPAGVVLAVIGILIIVKPESFTEFIIILAGAFIMLSGIMNFCQTLSLATLRFPYWWVGMIMSILTIIFSVLVITKPGKIADVIFIITGVFLICDGITDMWFALKIRKFAGRIRDEIEEVSASAGYTEPEDLMDDLP
ncbi:MAG: DUF308 domain-containing protein [Lachnospiraceae bacterium]|nr:DUF308 domain-containing protein [Lachnospiraceae bacterium]